jgi:hypothetical protein
MFHAKRTPDVPGTNSRHQLQKQRGTPSTVSSCNGKGLTVLPKWAWEELNFRPHAYQSGARTRLCNQSVDFARLPGARLALIPPEPRPNLGPRRTPRVPRAQLLLAAAPAAGPPGGGR